MRCRKAQREISRSIDGELDARREARLAQHLAACAECRLVAEDLRLIVHGAAGLAPVEPSERVWQNIRVGLEAAGAKPGGELVRPGTRPLFSPVLTAPRLAAAGVLAVGLVALGIVIGTRIGRTGALVDPEAKERLTLAKLDEAERHYRQAVQALGQAFAAGKGALAPQVAELFERNLAVIDAMIQASEAAVREEPDDLQARSFLLAAYEKKMNLLDSGLDLQRKVRDAEPKSRVI